MPRASSPWRPRQLRRRSRLLAALVAVTIDADHIIESIKLHRLYSLSFWDALIVHAAAAGRLRSSDDGSSAIGSADRRRRDRQPVRVAESHRRAIPAVSVRYRSRALISSRRARRVVARRPQDPCDGRLSRDAVEVERHLGPLLGDAAAAARTWRRSRTAPDGSLSLSLADTSGPPSAGGALPPARTCGDQAKTVAVTLAIWEAQLHPEISLRLDRLSPEPPPPGAGRRGGRARRARPGPLRRASSWRWGWPPRVTSSSAWAPSARLELALGPAGGRWRVRFAAVGVGPTPARPAARAASPGGARSSSSAPTSTSPAAGAGRWCSARARWPAWCRSRARVSPWTARRAASISGGEARARAEWRPGPASAPG